MLCSIFALRHFIIFLPKNQVLTAEKAPDRVKISMFTKSLQLRAII
jgi:hypothetical protein